MSSTGAKKGVLGIKKKHEEQLSGVKSSIERTDIELNSGDYYPTGDEYILVYETTKRLIPPQGIPPNVGVVVNNVETLEHVLCVRRSPRNHKVHYR